MMQRYNYTNSNLKGRINQAFLFACLLFVENIDISARHFTWMPLKLL
jgi:hypothetical protein